MYRKNLHQYFIIAFALIIIISFPKKAQNALRNQFFKPFIPLANLIPHSQNQPIIPMQKLKIQPRAYHPLFPQSVIARVIYRSPTNWNSFFWIDQGKNNPQIALNSPVLYENALVGVIDYVGKKQARVKLVTSSSLTVSVRAMRGKNQYYDLLNHINALSNYQCVQSQHELLNELLALKTKLIQSDESIYLAKGELFGLSQPLWRADGKILLGRGFNCSTQDELSIARELLSGAPIHSNDKSAPLILPDDLLITTGFDGIFPEGLAVAKVLTVDPLEEGGYYYSLKASPIIANLDSLSQVEVILPLNVAQEKTPSDS